MKTKRQNTFSQWESILKFLSIMTLQFFLVIFFYTKIMEENAITYVELTDAIRLALHGATSEVLQAR